MFGSIMSARSTVYAKNDYALCGMTTQILTYVQVLIHREPELNHPMAWQAGCDILVPRQTIDDCETNTRDHDFGIESKIVERM